MTQSGRRAIAAAVLLAVSARTSAAQGTGTVTGHITDAASGAPVAAAQVNVVGTTIGVVANGAGVYTLRGVSPGTVEVRVLRVGYTELKQTVTVTSGQTVTADFAMRPVPVSLSPVVTTVTGEQRSVEVGNAVTRVDAETVVQERPIANIGDLLTTRAAGVQVLPGTQAGVGSRVRIRGTSSLSLSNDPIYIVDGVRVESSSGSSSISIGGSTPSRVNDLNPDEIQSIEVVRGPSAATLYGTDAANGVIVITTKRGVAGRAQWLVHTEQGAIADLNDYPTAYRGWRNTSTATNSTQCILTQVAAGTCAQDSVTSFNLFDDKDATPFSTGHRQKYGAQVQGGSEAVRYFVSGDWEREIGVTEMPGFEIARLERQGVAVRDEWKNPNALTKAALRSNLTANLGTRADIGVNAGWVTSGQRLPQTDNNTTGLLSNAFGGPGFKGTKNGADSTYGYRLYTPGDIFQETVTQDVDRFIGSLNGNWRPAGWLAVRGNFGLDHTARVDSDLCRFENCADFSTSRLGFKVDNRTGFGAYTADIGATAQHQFTPIISTKTTLGAQFYRNIFDRNGANTSELPPGATSVTAGAVPGSDESTAETRTLGAYIEEAVGIRDRLFITGAVRSDRNSAFGADFKTVFYPKVSVSWVVSDESFLPKASWLDQLRLRTAYGASGVQPGTTDAVAFFSPTAGRQDGVDVPAVVINALGNAKLKPERSAELELGFDGSFFANRVNTEVTYYSKRSTDALIQRPLPPSLGVGTANGTASRFENLGEVHNWGWEWVINTQLLNRRAFGWDATFNGSHNSNELVDLGGVPPIRGSTNSQIEGYPLNGYWVRPIKSFADANGDGIIDRTEVVVGDTTEFRGYSQPRTELSFTNGFDFFNRRVRLTGLVDYKGGHKLYNNTERIRCQSRNNCRGLVDPSASLFEQARVVALRELGALSTTDGFIEDASFVRLREVALTVTAPTRWASLLRASRLSATASARNLHTWTDYTGVDPESNYAFGDIPTDFQTIAPPTYFLLRVNLGF